MVPGMNPEKILSIYDGSAEEPVVHFTICR